MDVQPGQRWRHKDSGRTYTVVRSLMMEVEFTLPWVAVVVYEDETGWWFARTRDRFLERFEHLPAAPV